MFGFVSGSCLVRVWFVSASCLVRVWVRGFVAGSCLVGSGSCLVRVWFVSVAYVSVSCLFRVRFGSGSGLGS